MRQKIWIKSSLLMILVLGLTACQTTEPKTEETTAINTVESTVVDSSVKADEKSEATIVIKITVDGEEIANQEDIKINEGDILLDVMKASFKVQEKDGFVTAIEGHTQDEKANKFWMFDVNGEMAPVGAGEYKLKDQDQIVWKLEAFE